MQTRKLNGPTPQGQTDKPGLSATLESKHSDLKVTPTTTSVKIVAKLYISTFYELDEKTMCFVFVCFVFFDVYFSNCKQ